MNENFEKLIKSLPGYQNQLIIHGERLLIVENGKYKVAAIQLSYEVWSSRQNFSGIAHDGTYILSHSERVITCNQDN